MSEAAYLCKHVWLCTLTDKICLNKGLYNVEQKYKKKIDVQHKRTPTYVEDN